MIKLYIIRHGEALSMEQDAERPLSDFGIAQVNKIALCLHQENIYVNDIYHSGILRAEQTANILSNKIGSGSVDVLTGFEPLDSAILAADKINSLDQDCIIVSHLPIVAEIVNKLAGSESSPVKVIFTTATVVLLEKISETDWDYTKVIRADDI